jgi:hypothetical protein
VASIRQNASTDRLPDLANLGVIARILIGVCAVGLVAALARARAFTEFADELLAIAGASLLPLLMNILALGLLSSALQRLTYRAGIVA